MNSIELPVSELKAALPGLKQIIGRKVTLPVLGCVRVCRLKSGRLTLQATDLDATATYATQVRAGDDSSVILVPGEELSQVLKGAAKDDIIQLVPDPKRPCLRHRVAGNWLEKPLPVFQENEWPPIMGLDSDPLALPESFPTALADSLDCCASEVRPPLHGAWLDVEDPKAHYVLGTDGHRLFSANSFTFGLKESLFVPYHRFLQWDGFAADGPWFLRLKPKAEKVEGYLQFNSPHWTFVAALPEVTQPNWKHVVPAQFNTRVRFSEEAATALLELLPKLPEPVGSDHGVEFRFDERHSTVTGRASSHASTAELTGLKVDGPALKIRVNRNFVIQALKLGLRQLDLVNACSPLVFHTDGRRMLAMPLREDANPAPATSPAQPQPESPAPEATDPAPNPEPQPTNTTPEPMSKETTPTPEASTEAPTALKQAIVKVEAIKDGLKAMLTDVNDVLKVLHVAQKEHRATEKEVEEVRAALDAVKKIRL